MSPVREETPTPAAATGTAPWPVTVISADQGRIPLNLAELWAYRELFFFLALRDVKVRYKQAALGITWGILQPVLQMLIFTLIFYRVAGLSAGEAPPALFSLAAILPWQLFANSLTRGGSSLVTNAHLITKVYFPRLIVPAAALGACLVDFLIALGVLVCMLVWYHVATPWQFHAGWPLLLLPVFMLLALLTSLAISLWLSAVNVRYRDVQQTIPFLVQVWMYLSPVAYPAEIIPEQWRLLYGLNPMTGVIQGFRWALLGSQPPDAMCAVSAGMILLCLVGSLYYFKRMEQSFADVV